MSEEARAYLHAHGIDIEPTELAEMVAEAVSSLPRSLPGEAGRELSPGEVAALERGGFAVERRELGERDPVARAAAATAALLADSFTTAELAERLGVDPSRIRQRLGERTLHGFKASGEWRIPAWQLDGERLLPGLERVLPALSSTLHPVAVWRWFTAPHPDLPAPEALRQGREERLAPRDWLRAGLPVEAVGVALRGDAAVPAESDRAAADLLLRAFGESWGSPPDRESRTRAERDADRDAEVRS